MEPKFQKRSALKFDGRIIPEAKPSRIIEGLILTRLAAGRFTRLDFLERKYVISI